MDTENTESNNEIGKAKNVHNLKIGVYKRYSTIKQDLKTQDKEIADFIQYKRYTQENIFFYVDEAISGGKLERPQFQKLIKDIENGRIDTVIASKLDRLARSSRDLQNFLHLLKTNKAELIVINGNIDTSTYQGKLFFDILSAFTEFERNIITERMKEGINRAKSEGKKCHRHKKDINVKRIIQLHDENKLSFNSIKKIFESEGKNYSLTTIISRYKEERK